MFRNDDINWKVKFDDIIMKTYNGKLSRSLSENEIMFLDSILQNTHLKLLTFNQTLIINNIYEKVVSKLIGIDELIGLTKFSYPELLNLIYNISNELVLWELTHDKLRNLDNTLLNPRTYGIGADSNGK